MFHLSIQEGKFCDYDFMSTSLAADSVFASENAAPASSSTNTLSRLARFAYVPPHLRNKPPTSFEPPSSSWEVIDQLVGSGPDFGYSQGYDSGGRSSGGRSSGGWNNRSGL